ncbi:uncharacterized protein [Aristolochia californica]|uniref:uncharacterized protein isoform X2 n=1 Tax=Aristolochia californica TaxID=171875 RepID=UPI0035DF2626
MSCLLASWKFAPSTDMMKSNSFIRRQEACSQVLGSSATTIRCCTNLLAPKEDLKGQKVAVIGLGVCGRAAARLALARGANVVAFDKNQHLVPLENDPLFGEYSNLKTVLGECDRSILEEADRVVVSPAVPLENYGLHALLQSGKEVISELDFAAEALPEEIKLIGITGTNGKSTTTVFTGQMLHYLGIKTFVGGNLGHPLSEAAIQCLKSPSANKMFEVAVVEVSSYMMEIPHKCFSPAVAVVLNLTPDHLERHKTMRNYAEMKCRVFAKMKCGKLAILPSGDQYLKAAFSEHAPKCNVAWIGDLPGIKVDTEKKVATIKIPTTGVVAQLQLGKLKTMGTHNYQNAAVAGFSVLGLDTGIDPDSINATLESLSPPSHRLQIVHRDVRGVTWVDDSKATNVEATYAGLMGLRNKKSIILLGGLAKILGDKEPNGFEKLIEPLRYHKCVITVIWCVRRDDSEDFKRWWLGNTLSSNIKPGRSCGPCKEYCYLWRGNCANPRLCKL